MKIKEKNYVTVTSKGAKIAREVMDYDKQWDEICSRQLTKQEFEEFKNTLKKNIFNCNKKRRKVSFYTHYIF